MIRNKQSADSTADSPHSNREVIINTTLTRRVSKETRQRENRRDSGWKSSPWGKAPEEGWKKWDMKEESVVTWCGQPAERGVERGPRTATRSRVGGCPQGQSSLGSGKALVKISRSCQKTQTWKVSKQREPQMVNLGKMQTVHRRRGETVDSKGTEQSESEPPPRH